MAIASRQTRPPDSASAPDFRAEGRLPLVIGVTGHRTFEPSAHALILEEAEDFFRTLSKQLPNTPVVVLSSLAAGADLLIAKIARSRGLALSVALPLSADDYLTSANYAPDELADVRDLLDHSERTLIVSDILHLAEETPDGSGEDFSMRAYRLAGAYVAHHSHVLMALWDDGETGAESVTAATIRYKLGGAPEAVAGPLGLLEPVETGYVHHIFAPRPGSLARDKAPGHVARLYADAVSDSASAAAVYERILRNLERFNKDAAQAARKDSLRARIAASERDLIGDAAHLQTPDLEAMVKVHAVTDVLSQRHQRAAKRRFVTIISLLILAPMCIAFYGDWPQADRFPWLLLVASLSIAGVFAVVGATRLHGTPQDRYQDYRALAEALRVRFYWRVAGLPAGVARHYLFKEKTELDWIRQALRTMDGPVYRAHAAPATTQDRLERCRLIRERWLGDQKTWFQRRGKREERRAGRLERTIMDLGVLYTGLALIAGVWMTSGHSRGTFLPEGAWGLHDVVVLCFDAIALTTAVCQLCVERMAWSSHAREYHKMGRLFERAYARMGPLLEAGDVEGAAEVFAIVGREALSENGDWLLMHRERPLESTILG